MDGAPLGELHLVSAPGIFFSTPAPPGLEYRFSALGSEFRHLIITFVGNFIFLPSALYFIPSGYVFYTSEGVFRHSTGILRIDMQLFVTGSVFASDFAFGFDF